MTPKRVDDLLRHYGTPKPVPGYTDKRMAVTTDGKSLSITVWGGKDDAQNRQIALHMLPKLLAEYDLSPGTDDNELTIGSEIRPDEKPILRKEWFSH